MVLRFGDTWACRCMIVVVLTLATCTSGHIIRQAGSEDSKAIPEAYNDAVPFAGTDAETAWMVTAIIFIVLFALAIIVCIYLWYLRNAKMKELRHLQNIRLGTNKDNQNVWYGGGAHM
ncbi:membrane protein ORF30 [Anopheles sinensis]|uniref:Membrane protein ORF30 n=1 Tax=Anopheles sinensis TaxID=74873 RepID=A0A084VRJ1_ANOSI|nr:membrane protein ORF30 [Anopheles sinensis]